MTDYITYEDFERVDIRLGTSIKAEKYSELKNPSIKLQIDFGKTIGIKKSSAQLLQYYEPNSLLGKQIIAVVNFKPKQIGKFISEVLVLGFPDKNSQPILVTPDIKSENGVKLF